MILRSRSSSMRQLLIPQEVWTTYDQFNLINFVPDGDHLFKLLSQQPIITSPDKVLQSARSVAKK